LPRLKFVLAKAGIKSLPETVGFFLAILDNVEIVSCRLFTFGGLEIKFKFEK